MANPYVNVNGSETRTVRMSSEEDSDEGEQTAEEDEEDYEDGEEEETTDGDEEKDYCARLIETHCWNYCVVTLIMLNTIALAIECETPDWPGWLGFECAFVSLFTIEITIRLYAYGWSFFTDPREKWWNIFDFVIISLGLADLIGRLYLYGHEDHLAAMPYGGNIVTCVRVIRCLRVLRSVRLLREFKQLNLLTVGFVYAIGAAMWMSLLFSLIISIFAIFTTTLLGNHADLWAAGPGGNPEDEAYIEEHFGGLWSSWITMFQVITLDEWSSIIRVVKKQMPMLVPCFMAYIMLMAFTMISLLTGVMAQKITKTALETDEAEKERAYNRFMKVLALQFKANDTGAGLSVEQLLQVFDTPDLVEPLRKLNRKGIMLSANDIRDMCQAMDMGRYNLITWQRFEVSLSQFLEAGSAKNLFLLRSDVQRLEKMMARSQLTNSAVAAPAGPSAGLKMPVIQASVVG